MGNSKTVGVVVDCEGFEKWLQAVERRLIGWVVSADMGFDVPLVYFVGWHVQGFTPRQAAELALEEMGCCDG